MMEYLTCDTDLSSNRYLILYTVVVVTSMASLVIFCLFRRQWPIAAFLPIIPFILLKLTGSILVPSNSSFCEVTFNNKNLRYGLNPDVFFMSGPSCLMALVATLLLVICTVASDPVHKLGQQVSLYFLILSIVSIATIWFGQLMHVCLFDFDQPLNYIIILLSCLSSLSVLMDNCICTFIH